MNLVNLKSIVIKVKEHCEEGGRNLKWSYVNDLVFTLLPVCLLGFFIQTDDYSFGSTL